MKNISKRHKILRQRGTIVFLKSPRFKKRPQVSSQHDDNSLSSSIFFLVNLPTTISVVFQVDGAMWFSNWDFAFPEEVVLDIFAKNHFSHVHLRKKNFKKYFSKQRKSCVNASSLSLWSIRYYNRRNDYKYSV